MCIFELVGFLKNMFQGMELLGHMVVLDLGVFLFLRNLHTASQSGNTNLHSHQQCVGSLFSVSLPTFVVCGLLDDSHLTDVQWYLIVVLICISPKQYATGTTSDT